MADLTSCGMTRYGNALHAIHPVLRTAKCGAGNGKALVPVGLARPTCYRCAPPRRGKGSGHG